MSYAKKNIGNVALHLPSKKPKQHYADRAEDTLLELFSGKDVPQKTRKILEDDPSWALYYHLAPERANLVHWYNFAPGSNVLEIGAGCGAVTEELVRHDINVTALELTEKRATINAHRNKAAENLEVIVDNLQSYTTSKKFDYVLCVGVLEYAGRFIESDDPYNDFLELMKKRLKPGGKLLIAIENRFGLKYWTGATEDHTHRFFEGHNGYPYPHGVRTFGRKELTSLLESAGCRDVSFFYPFPDYKLPHTVYSDAYYPGNGATFPLGSLPVSPKDWKREHFMSEQNIMRYIEENGLFPDFSNSFFVEATL